jgi:PhnB protein
MSGTPEGMHTITPHIVVRDPVAAAGWYADAFEAVERNRVPLPGGGVLYLELRLGDSSIMVADELPDFGIVSPLTIGDSAVVLHLFTDDADAVWQRAVDAGAEVLHPLEDQFWGDRQGQLRDPFGHKWNVATHRRDVSAEEIAAAAAAAFAHPGGAA